MGISTDIAEKNDYYINYIENVGGRHCRKSVDDIFYIYCQEKEKLYKTFGNRLKVEKHIDIDASYNIVVKQLHQIYGRIPYVIYRFSRPQPDISPFITSLSNYIYDNFSSRRSGRVVGDSPLGEVEEIINAINLCIDEHVIFNQALAAYCELTLRGKKCLKLPMGMRPMRAVRKIIDYIGFPHIDLFEEWRDEVSMVLTTKKISGTLVLSIDPIDFLTLSNNNSNWSSCVTMPTGSYCNTIPAMMNSSYAFIAYLKNPEPYVVNGMEYDNKSWRTLMFYDVDNDRWVCNTCEYPFHSEGLLLETYKFINEVVGETDGTVFDDPIDNDAFVNVQELAAEYYGYDCEEYEDDDGYFDEDEFYENIESGDGEIIDILTEGSPTGSVLLCTSPYYNDIFSNSDRSSREYMVAWNRDVHSRHPEYVDVAGPMTCIYCGSMNGVAKRFSRDNHYEDENETGICGLCWDNHKKYDYIMVPLLSGLNSLVALRKEIRTRLAYDMEEFTEEDITKYIKENIYVNNHSRMNDLVHRNIPISYFNNTTFDEVALLRCYDSNLPELSSFIIKGDWYPFYRVGYCNDNGEIQEVEQVTTADYIYFIANMCKENKTDEIARNNKFFPYLSNRAYLYNSDGERYEVEVELAVPKSYKDKKNMLEVISDREEKYKVLSSL